MPIKIDTQLPARSILEQENVFVMSRERAMQQDIRPLRIVILNLMPTKIETETQLLRVLGNSPLQVDIELLQMASHVSKNTSKEHLLQFYKTFDDIKHERFDGMIITGAPVENMAFEDVGYWPELCEIMAWSRRNVWSTFHICWGAMAGLYFHHGIQKQPLAQKCFGVFAHELIDPCHPLLRGLDDTVWVPHSRHTAISRKDIESTPQLKLISWSSQAGVHLVSDQDCRNFYATGHGEYDRDTLAKEYMRDIAKGRNIALPMNYFPNDDPAQTPLINWRGAANLLFSNWLNYFVYQHTPYDLTTL